jgi:N-acetylmuramoyl-L-alanine amidase
VKPEDKDNFYKLPPNDQLAILLFLECRGEPIEGQIAVGCVVRNRVKGKQGNSYFTVITEKNQFSCFNSNDKEYGIGMNMVKELAENKMPEDLTGLFQQCRWLAQGIINGSLKDNTQGAQYYYNPKLCNPTWAKDMTITRIIGNHIFLRKG